MQRLWPAPSIFLAAADEDIIVLDVANDRYDCLADAAAVVRLEETSAIVASNAEVATQLRDMGIATDRRSLSPTAPLIKPVRELQLDPRPPCGDVVRAAVVLSSATLQFRGKSLSQLVRHRPKVRAPSPTNEARLAQIVGAVRVARPSIPFEGECLQRAFLLRAVLAAQGVAADWMFGVRTFPFAAHCWLQIGDMVVGDRLNRASRFVPIMRA